MLGYYYYFTSSARRESGLLYIRREISIIICRIWIFFWITELWLTILRAWTLCATIYRWIRQSFRRCQITFWLPSAFCGKRFRNHSLNIVYASHTSLDKYFHSLAIMLNAGRYYWKISFSYLITCVKLATYRYNSYSAIQIAVIRNGNCLILIYFLSTVSVLRR